MTEQPDQEAVIKARFNEQGLDAKETRFVDSWPDAQATFDNLERRKILRSGTATIPTLQGIDQTILRYWLTDAGKEWVKTPC